MIFQVIILAGRSLGTSCLKTFIRSIRQSYYLPKVKLPAKTFRLAPTTLLSGNYFRRPPTHLAFPAYENQTPPPSRAFQDAFIKTSYDKLLKLQKLGDYIVSLHKLSQCYLGRLASSLACKQEKLASD